MQQQASTPPPTLMDRSTARLRVGLAGAGLMGRWHADASRRVGGTVVAVMDRDTQAAARLAGRHPGAAGFADLETMLSQAHLDVLHICTPLETHLSMAERALEAGVHLLIEKPLTASAPETQHLLDRARQQALALCPIHQFPFQDGARKALSWLPRLGPIVHMEATFCSAGAAGKPDAHRDAVVADILPHPLSLMQVFLPEGVPEAGWHTLHPGTGEFQAMCEASGTTLSMRISMNGRPTTCAFRIVGTAGTIDLNMFHGYAVVASGSVSRTRKITAPFGEALRKLAAASLNLGRRALRREPAYPGLRPLIQAFYHAVQTGGALPVAPEDIVRIAQTRDRLMAQASLPART